MTEEAKKGGPQLVYSAPLDDATASFVPPWVPMPGNASPPAALPPRIDFRKAPQRRTDIVKGLIPDADVTLLGGHGGAGKGFFTLQASCAVSLGVPFMGCQTLKGPVLYWSAEDPEDRVTWRLQDICRLHGYDLDEVHRNLHIFDATEFDGFYGEMQRGGSEGSSYRALGEMPGYGAYRELVKQIDPLLCIVDGTGDTYEGNDLVRQQVKAFIRLLLRVNKNRRVATVLTTHTDRSHSRGSRTGDDGYVGSAQWHNGVRSRLYFEVEKKGAGERLLLKGGKFQDGPMSAPLELRRGEGGVLFPVMPKAPQMPEGTAVPPAPEQVVLELIAEHYAKEFYVSSSFATNTPDGVYESFRDLPNWPFGMERRRTLDLMRQLARNGYVEEEGYSTKSRNKKSRWKVIRSWGEPPFGGQSDTMPMPGMTDENEEE